MIIEFEKEENGKWYAILDDYEGDHEDLEMVDGADKFLDQLTWDDRLVKLEVYEEEPSIGTFSILEMVNHDDFGATYNVIDCQDFSGTVWLCNVMHYVYKEHPETLYFIQRDTDIL